MKRVITVCLAVAMAVLLAGCQPTPDESVVVQKDMQQMIEKGMEASASQAQSPAPMTYEELCKAYGVPERYKASMAEGNLTVNCDAAIELPSTASLPMAKVEAGRFSQEQVYAFFKALCGDTPMYVPPELMDKEYYEEQILKLRQEITEITDKGLIDSLNGTIADLEKKYKTAPEDIKLIPADGTLETMEVQDNTDTISGGLTETNATSAPFGQNAMRFSVINDAEYENDEVYTFVDEEGNTQTVAPWSGSRLSFEREGKNTSYSPVNQGRKVADVTELSLSGGAIQGCTLRTTLQQARETVETLLHETGTDDMAIDAVSLYSLKNDASTETQAYVFRLLRKVNGVSVESASGSRSQSSMEGMGEGKDWSYESLSISVDDNGIANLYWTAPLAVTEIMTEHTSIRPWSEIEDIFGKMIVVQNAIGIDSDGRTTIDVTRVSLSLRRIMERDSYTTGLLVPVWNFFGRKTYTDKDVPTVMDYKDYPLITINAVDGSVIDIDKGY